MPEQPKDHPAHTSCLKCRQVLCKALGVPVFTLRLCIHVKAGQARVYIKVMTAERRTQSMQQRRHLVFLRSGGGD